MTEEEALREWADQCQADERLQRETRMEERAAIVAWLRDKFGDSAEYDAIEAEEHLK